MTLFVNFNLEILSSNTKELTNDAVQSIFVTQPKTYVGQSLFAETKCSSRGAERGDSLREVIGDDEPTNLRVT